MLGIYVGVSVYQDMNKLSARERNKGTGNRKAPVASCLMDSLFYYLVFRDVGCKFRGKKLKYFKLQVLSM